MKRPLAIIGSLIGILALLLVLSRSYEQQLPFETIAQGGSHGDFGVTAYREPKPALLVVATAGEVEDLTRSTLAESPVLVDQLGAVDYRRYFALLALHGEIGSSGYSITIIRVTRRNDEVLVEAQFDSPAQDTGRLPVFTSPYHLVAISKEGRWGEAIRFNLIDDGRSVAETIHLIP